MKPTKIAPADTPEKPKPTQVGTRPSMKPTAISGESTPVDPPSVVRIVTTPTAVHWNQSVPPSPATQTPATPKPAAPKVFAPTALGEVRKFVRVEVPALRIRFPGIPDKTLDQVRLLLGKIMLETLTLVQCKAWGQEVQQGYSDSVTLSLRLAEDKRVGDGTRHLLRLYTLLGEIHESFQEKRGFTLWKGPTPWEMFKKHRQEIDQLRGLLQTSLPALENLNTEFEGLRDKLSELGIRLGASALAAEYLSDLFSHEEDRKKQVLLERSVSLMQTVASIQAGLPTRAATMLAIDALTRKIRDTVLTTLPSWLEQVSFASTQSSHTETELYSFRQGIDGILEKMK